MRLVIQGNGITKGFGRSKPKGKAEEGDKKMTYEGFIYPVFLNNYFKHKYVTQHNKGMCTDKARKMNHMKPKHVVQ